LHCLVHEVVPEHHIGNVDPRVHRLVDAGNTVVIIEHNLDIVKSADHVIDLGPEGGDDGGYIIAEGTPEKVAKIKKSYTGQFLKRILAGAATGKK